MTTYLQPERAIPRPLTERWVCQSCHAMLGEVVGRTVTIRISTRHGARREVTAHLPCTQRCEHCGAISAKGFSDG